VQSISHIMEASMSLVTKMTGRHSYSDCFTWKWDEKRRAKNEMCRKVNNEWVVVNVNRVVVSRGKIKSPQFTPASIVQSAGSYVLITEQKNRFKLPNDSVRILSGGDKNFFVCDVLSVFQIRFQTHILEVVGCFGYQADGCDQALFNVDVDRFTNDERFEICDLEALFVGEDVLTTSPAYSPPNEFLEGEEKRKKEREELEKRFPNQKLFFVNEEHEKVVKRLDSVEKGIVNVETYLKDFELEKHQFNSVEEQLRLRDQVLDVKTVLQQEREMFKNEIQAMMDKLSRVYPEVEQQKKTVLVDGEWRKIEKDLTRKEKYENVLIAGKKRIREIQDENDKKCGITFKDGKVVLPPLTPPKVEETQETKPAFEWTEQKQIDKA